MNGVRKFLSAATGSSSSQPSPLNLSDNSGYPPLVSPGLFSPNPGPSWPPAGVLPEGSPPAASVTPALVLVKKQKPRPPVPPQSSNENHSRTRSVASVSSFSGKPNGSRTSSPSVTPSSSPHISLSRLLSRKSVPKVDTDVDFRPDWKRSSTLLNTRDELIISLLASEAMVDSREYDILTSEEVEELKKALRPSQEHHVLQSRLSAATQKLSLETKIRDAAKSLVKVNSSHKKVSKQSEDQLEAANKRVDTAQAELLRVSQRASEVHRRLMEHRASVLSLSVRNMEKKLAPKQSIRDSGYNSPIQNGTPCLSPSRSVMSAASTSTRFDGAHLFAGHADAIVPKRVRTPDAAASEITTLEEKLKAATEALTAAGKKQAELQRELSVLRLEKQEVETTMALELQSAEDTISALEQELPRLESLEQQHLDDRNQWEEERIRLEERLLRVGELETLLSGMESRNGEAALIEKALAEEKERSRREMGQKEEEIRQLMAVLSGEKEKSRRELEEKKEETMQLEEALSEEVEKRQRELEQKEEEIKKLMDSWSDEREQWERERVAAQGEKLEDLARLQEELERQKEDDLEILRAAGQELEEGLAAVDELMQAHEIVLFSRDTSLPGLAQAIGSHLQKVHSKLEMHAQAEEEWTSLRRRLENDIRSGLDKREALQMQLEEARRARDDTVLELNRRLTESPAQQSIAPLPPVEISVSLETDVAKVTSILLPLWNILPSPEVRVAKFSNNQRGFRTGSPIGNVSTGVKSIADLDVRSLKTLYDSARSGSGASGPFTFEAFAARVQALIADDRSLIERLIRFAQAHDMLRQNADRAQRLAMDGTNSLETYQKQVKTLEERNAALMTRMMQIQEEMQFLQDAADRLEVDKQELEEYAAEQAETLQQLTDANNALSARTLSLAEEAANGPDKIRRQLEIQLAECRNQLQAAETEVNAMRMSEQSQRLLLMDELNSVQTENDRLRDQLRGIKR